MIMILSIEAYDKAEAEARKTACYPALRAFSPVYFHQHGVPTNATCEAELARYVDMMGEVRALDGWDKARFLDWEADQIIGLQRHVQNLTGITPISNVLSPWPILRVVRHISHKLGRKLRIFEGAAGCGYLGAYLIGDGHDYTGFDITQGLYLWQNRLWSSLDEVAEWDIGFCSMSDRVHHWPWWTFAKYHLLPQHFDLVICDSALGEMGWFGYQYFIHAAREMINESEFGCLLLTSVGDPKNQNREQVVAGLYALGLRLHEVGGVMVFSKPEFPYKIFRDFPKPNGRRLSEFFKAPDPLHDNYDFMKFAGLC